jgi:hypothetical protein
MHIKSSGGGEICEFWYAKYICFWNNWQGSLNTRSWSWRTDKISQPHSNQFLSHVRTYIVNEIARRDLYFMQCKQMLEKTQVVVCKEI